MELVLWAIAGLAGFCAVWILIVAPAEKRHHERKLALLERRIERHEAARQPDQRGAEDRKPAHDDA